MLNGTFHGSDVLVLASDVYFSKWVWLAPFSDGIVARMCSLREVAVWRSARFSATIAGFNSVLLEQRGGAGHRNPLFSAVRQWRWRCRRCRCQRLRSVSLC